MPQMAIRRTMWVERTLAYCLLALLVAVLIGVLLAASKPAHAAATFAVNSTADTEDTTPEGTCDSDPTATVTCTLREAIQEANFVSGADTINFAIPSSSDSNCNATTGVCTIRPNLELPPITDTVTINGYTQPGTIANTSTTNTTSAALKIVLGGGLAGPSSGLHIDAPNVVVRGLVINGWDNYGIDVSGAGSGTRIEGNFIGTDVTGTLDAGNRVEGVSVFGAASGVTIGGTLPKDRNLISGNGDATTAGHGVEINSGFSGGVATDNKVEGNLIGTNANGTDTPDDLGNTGWGVLMAAPNNSVGGTASGAANTIAFNDRDGVAVLFNGSTGNRILSNSIFSNDELGIDLSGGTENVSGVTANDRKDPDTGANNLQNYPKLTSATTVSGTTTTTIKGTLNSRPRKTFTIQFFSSQTADPSGFGEGKTFLGEIQVKTNRFGKRSFTFPAVLPPGENVVSATATNNLTGDTSEFSNAVTAS